MILSRMNAEMQSKSNTPMKKNMQIHFKWNRLRSVLKGSFLDDPDHVIPIIQSRDRKVGSRFYLMYSNTELYCSNIKQISTIPRQDSQHEITMTPLREMAQKNEPNKNISRTNKNEQINASSESLGILSFIKILNTEVFHKNLYNFMKNHVI